MLGWRDKRKPTPENGRLGAQSNNNRPPFPKASRDGRFSDDGWDLNDSVYVAVMQTPIKEMIEGDEYAHKELKKIIGDRHGTIDMAEGLIGLLAWVSRNGDYHQAIKDAFRLIAKPHGIKLDTERLETLLTRIDRGEIQLSDATGDICEMLGTSF